MSQQSTIIIPPASGSNPGIIREPVSGRYYATISATSGFKLRVNSQEVDQGAGRYYGDRNTPEFGALTFLNYSTSAVTVTYYSSFDAPYVPDPNAAIGAVNVTVNSTVTEASSYTKGTGVQTLADTASNTYTGLDGSKVRKQFTVRNRSTSAGALDIKDGSGNIMDTINPGDPPWTHPTNGTFTVTANGGSVDYTVGQTFYS